jgi:DNA-binding MarR family transcriptional regulator
VRLLGRAGRLGASAAPSQATREGGFNAHPEGHRAHARMCASGRDRSRQNQCHFTPAWVRARNGAPASEISRRRRRRTALRRAAERLHVAQPAVSEQVRKLEQELGVKLFDRNQRTVELTVAGVALLEEARHVLRHAEVAQQAARNSGDLGNDAAAHRLPARLAPRERAARAAPACGSAPRVDVDLTAGLPPTHRRSP